MAYDATADGPGQAMPAYVDHLDELYHLVADLIKENQGLRMELEASNQSRHKEKGTTQERMDKIIEMIRTRDGRKTPFVNRAEVPSEKWR